MIALIHYVSRFGLIAAIDLSLSGDDALVIAMAARDVPPEWRRTTVILGALTSVALQVTFAALISIIIGIPLVHAAGGLLLVWIAWKLVVPQKEEAHASQVGTSILHAVRIIVLADISLSLDNVLALVAVSKGNLLLLGGGLLLSAAVLLWGAVWLSGLMMKFRWLVYVGGGILLWVALGMILEDEIIGDILPPDVLSEGLVIRIAVMAVLAAAVWWYLRMRAVGVPLTGREVIPEDGV